MKTSKLLPILLFTIALAFYGCKKSNPTPVPTLNNAIIFTFQGAKYTVTNPLVSYQSGSLSISGQVIGGPGADLTIGNYQTPTTEAIDGLNGPSYVHFDLHNSNTDDNWFINSGTLTVSSISQTHASGTFTGEARLIPGTTDTPVSGAFNVDIPQQ